MGRMKDLAISIRAAQIQAAADAATSVGAEVADVLAGCRCPFAEGVKLHRLGCDSPVYLALWEAS